MPRNDGREKEVFAYHKIRLPSFGKAFGMAAAEGKEKARCGLHDFPSKFRAAASSILQVAGKSFSRDTRPFFKTKMGEYFHYLGTLLINTFT
jgi:hypothetical protein